MSETNTTSKKTIKINYGTSRKFKPSEGTIGFTSEKQISTTIKENQ